MKYSTLTTLQILSGINLNVAAAQRLAYTTFAVTECVSEADSMPYLETGRHDTPIVSTATDKTAGTECPETITLSYTMPSCVSCDCPDCTALSSFTTAYPAFDTLGMKTQSYAVTETYIGLSSLPRFERPTQIPYGFITGVETCHEGHCGPKDITATVTYPAGGRPFSPTPSPAGGNLSTATTPAPVATQATPVTAGAVLYGPLDTMGVFVLLIAAL
ncbi:hypothetical protein F4802DRAFT_586878 [Xylaria palmicola]|nr:hypothetical protein F4802DRAFT_586878 [Xylaria palmicola]